MNNTSIPTTSLATVVPQFTSVATLPPTVFNITEVNLLNLTDINVTNVMISNLIHNITNISVEFINLISNISNFNNSWTEATIDLSEQRRLLYTIIILTIIFNIGTILSFFLTIQRIIKNSLKPNVQNAPDAV
jgi:hypothetical protein